jgi:fluoride exporter
MTKMFFIVGIGSFIGGSLRYVSNIYIQKYFYSSFPLGTFTINIVGCFLIGIFMALGEKGNLLSPEIRMFLTTGFCGGFTTFSTFSYENLNLIKNKEIYYFSLNVGLSVAFGLLATFVGYFLAKFFLNKAI